MQVDVYEINLRDTSDEDLMDISEQMGIGLSIEEMRSVREYFISKGRNPTDIELQALGQAWSEHCCYKSSKPILKETIFVIDAPQNIHVIKEDAGVVEFDDSHAYVVALESHNHPSAIEPYGGSATGIGGIIRDVVCMGAQPIALIDPLFFGNLDYAHEKLPKGVNHPKYLLSGVVSGIRDYGNRIGIPTVGGMIYFHKHYLGNCIVNVGCVGIVRKENIILSRVKEPGNIYVLAGGKTGRDGIHGVTFASAELDEGSEEESRGAVQLGDPIMKEPLIHACLEANEKGLLEGMKDLGGGGLSCVTGEMALAGGFGARVWLDKVPLKDEEIKPWEIWVSESQERMMLAVKPSNLDEVLRIFEKWDIPATAVGEVIPEKVLEVYWEDKKIFEMDLEFLTKGVEYCRPFKLREVESKEIELPEEKDFNTAILNLLSSPNIASKEFVIRQYDHEVRACTVVKPMHGKIGHFTHGDASVIKPLEDSWQGLAVSTDVNPSFLEIDPYAGACSALDEVCRNLVSVGAMPHSFADCLNFGNPEKPDRMGDFRETCRALGDLAKFLEIPFVSGNVSFYNESASIPIPPTPTILGVGIVKDVRKCVTADLKSDGNTLFLIGETKREMGGSEYCKLIGLEGGAVPKVDFDCLKGSIKRVLGAIDKGLIKACHDISEGGLGICIAEMCIGGDVGVEIDIESIADLRCEFKLFSESNTRWVVEVEKRYEENFLETLEGLKVFKIGAVKGRNLIIDDGERELVNLSINEVKEAWDNGLKRLIGE